MREVSLSTMGIPDYLGSFVLSHKMAKAINSYWRVRGVDAGARVLKEVVAKDAPPIYSIRSNLKFDVRS